MKEDFLIYIWSQRLLKPELKTQENENLTIIKPGEKNLDSGPDFFNSMIKLDDNIWAGNIEVHVKSSDWDKHGHTTDLAYDNIILHVVYENDKPIKRNNGEIIPCLVIKDCFDENIINTYNEFLSAKTWIACENMISNIGHFELHNWLDKLTIERLENRANNILEELDSNKFDFQETFYHKLAKGFGFNTNAVAFELLAVNTPLSILSKHRNNILQIEALLYGQAGFLNQEYSDDYPNQLKKEYLFLSHKYNLKPMHRKLWKFMRLRPSNFPTIRISQFASFIQKSEVLITKIFETKNLQTIISLFETSSSVYWERHYQFDKKSKNKSKKKLGASSIDLLIINTIVPFTFTYGQINNIQALKDISMEWLEKTKAENNLITRNFIKNSIIPSNAFQSQALIQLYKKYCLNMRCLECRIGHKLLNEK